MNLEGAPAIALFAAAIFACIAALSLLGLLIMLMLWWRSRPVDWTPPQPSPISTSDAEDAAPEMPAAGPPTRPAALANAVRSIVLRRIVEQAPPGCRCLVLSPPPHPDHMTWHIHLGVNVALDLADGRTVPTSAPAAAHHWKLPSGNRAAVAIGDPNPAPGKETRTVRVEGQYLTLRFAAGQPGSFQFEVAEPSNGGHRWTTSGADLARVEQIVREGLDAALSGRAKGGHAAMGYRPSSWRVHERLWVEVQH